MTPATTLRDAYNAVDPTMPLPSGDPRYVNCNDVRGNEDTVAQMFRTISYSERYTHQLFTGHRGCGKSTELLRLKARLDDANFYVVYFAVDEDLDPNDLIYSDLLLSVARRAEAQFRADGIQLDEQLRAIERWFSEVVYQQDEWRNVERQLESEASLGLGLPEAVPIIARLFAKLTGQIRTGDAVKTEIRRRLDQQISQLIDYLNGLMLKADAEVRKRGQRGIVVMVDNLDRVTLKDLGDGRTSHSALYLEHGDQLCALNCHTIYTVPISMMYAQNVMTLRGIFPDSRVLPMIKTHEPRAKGGAEAAAGLERLRSILSHRIDLSALFEPAAVDYLCRASGGHPRDLMTLVRHSIEYADEYKAPPITLAAAQRAHARLVAAFSRMVPEEHFEKLARVYLTNRITNDADHQAMLFNLSVLEYVNGEEPWHDVHPAVQHLSRFQKALDDERAKLAPGA